MDKRLIFIICISLVILQISFVSPSSTITYNSTHNAQDKSCSPTEGCTNTVDINVAGNGIASYRESIYLYWNLSEIEGKGYTINSANISLMVNLDQEDYSIPVNRLTESFIESDQNIPASTSSIHSYTTDTSAGSRQIINVTEIVQNWSDGIDNYGFELDGATYTDSWYIRYDSSEDATVNSRPLLIIEYSDTVFPNTTINHPTDLQYFNSGTLIDFNVTATDISGIANCSLYLNSTGWHLNQTNSSAITSGVEYKFEQNFTEGVYLFGFKCFDTFGLSNTTSNYTFTVDTTFPVLDITTITVAVGSQSFNFNASINDTHLNSCKYSIYDSSGLIDGTNENVSFTCNVLKSATATAYGTYTLRTYAIDLASNENYTEENFTLTPNVGAGTPPGGSSSSPSTTGLDLAKNFTITTINLQNKMDISLAKDSRKPREKVFYITNGGLDALEVEVYCSTEETNESSQDINICDYVFFSENTFTVSPNQENPTIGYVKVITPENSSIRDKYYFNIIATSTESGTSAYSKLSVSTRLSLFALLYKWSYISKQSIASDSETTKTYPVWTLALIISLIVSIGIFIGGNKLFADKGNTSLGAFFLSSGLFLVVFFFMLEIL